MRLSFLLFLGFLSVSLFAQEEILNYHADISIGQEDEITVVETIRVRAEGQQIRRGITRNIPLERPGKNGETEPAPIKIIGVKRDGKKENYRSEKGNRSVTLYMGKKDKFLDPGIYTYEITYTSRNQIGFFEDYDELYWNVIGNDVIFPVLEFSAVIHFPTGAKYLRGSCYTGRGGSSESACTLTESSDGESVQISGERALSPYEAFTIAVAWPKGYVKDDFQSKLKHGIWNILLFLAGILIFVIKGYEWWVKVGKDPPDVAVVPDWHPPAGMSPAEVSYLYHREITDKTVSAALVSAGTKGKIRIENEKKKFTFRRLDRSEGLAAEERVLVDYLVPGDQPFVLKESTYSRYQSAKSAFTSKLKTELNIEDYFRQNFRYLFRGTLLLALITAFALTWKMIPRGNYFMLYEVFTFAGLMALYITVSLSFYIRKWYRWIIFPVLLLIACGFFYLIFSQVLFYVKDSDWAILMIGGSALVVGIFSYLIYAPTPAGQEMKAKIAGFKMYLDKSEKEMLNYFTPPEKTPELFEKMLPYAIALGVENKWGKKFESVLAKAIREGTYAPVWYVGNIHNINSLHSNFSSAVSSAAPKSSSGSGGGGFSGGGGGGGGVGGW